MQCKFFFNNNSVDGEQASSTSSGSSIWNAVRDQQGFTRVFLRCRFWSLSTRGLCRFILLVYFIKCIMSKYYRKIPRIRNLCWYFS